MAKDGDMATPMSLHTDRIDKMLKEFRPMAILLDGIWQIGSGLYLSVKVPYTVKFILNGKEIIIDKHPFLDFYGYTDSDVEKAVIQRNLSTLPPLKKKRAGSINNSFYDDLYISASSAYQYIPPP